ncbi:ROK family protein [Microlunatus aurantiacus]|uniref:ROK family protein n=1 Tax=Microlunatus aurantiacus TaxID=446786 RepID=A0ABP7D131_9ACTN
MAVSRSGSARAAGHAAVIEALRREGPTTRTELERMTGLGRKIISERVQELLDKSLVTEGELARSTGGRMPRRIGFRPEVGLVGVVEMNVHHVTLGLTDLGGQVLVLRQIDAEVSAGPAAAVELVADGMIAVLEEVGHALDELWGIGVGVLAPVDRRRGSILPGRLFARSAMAGWDGYPVRDRLHELLGRSVWVDNEVNLMALGEVRSGRARGFSDVVFAKLGPSVGGGLVVGGRLQHGKAAAGEIGHLVVPHDEPRPCWCGGRGCLDTFVNDTVLLAEAGGVHGSVAELSRSATAGDPGAVAVLRRAGSRVGAVLADVVTLLDPSLLLVGGTLVDDDEIVLSAIKAAIADEGISVAAEGLLVEHSHLSDRAGLVGAAAMVVDELFSPAVLGVWLDDGRPVGRLDALVRTR